MATAAPLGRLNPSTYCRHHLCWQMSMIGREVTVGQVLLPRLLKWQRDRITAIRSLRRRLLFIRTWVCVSRSNDASSGIITLHHSNHKAINF
eukprot:4905009-Pleurochrysis_carterae.AAC.1